MSGCGKITETSVKLLVITALATMGLVSCSAPVKVEGFDHESWIADTNACHSKRAVLVDVLLQHKEEFMNKKDEQLMKYIGKPDKSLFFSRGKKTFIYQVDAGKECENRVLLKNVRSLRFDVNALGRIELVYMIAQ
ncbi:MAG: hypothetical protein K0R51_2270 [Cytophagaceae bacterium]|nr:hypothetical protein [Cytophagaceae bacterium]